MLNVRPRLLWTVALTLVASSLAAVTSAQLFLLLPSPVVQASDPVLVPVIDGAWWKVAGDPDLGKYTTATQQPVDFGIWPAADGSWQLWSCIRNTAYPGRTRLFHRWQAAKLTDKDWQPMGIAMEADPKVGETEGGLQAPHVLKHGDQYYMFYGDWNHICLARSSDGKTFTRQLTPDGTTGMFTDGGKTRDPMALRIGELFYVYYTAHPPEAPRLQLGAAYVRTSKDLRTWSAATKVAFGGAAGSDGISAECPFVYYHKPSASYYLFRTQRYGENAQSTVYRSKDPTNFGIEDDSYLVGTIPYAAPEIIEHDGQTYIAALLPSLKGIQIAKLKWAPKS